MPRKAESPIAHSLFAEPVFNEDGAPTPDPTTFRTPHDPKVDDQIYKQVQSLLQQDVVSFPVSTVNPGDLFSLEGALGANGPADLQAIQNAKKVVFHAAGDTGASIVGKLGNELTVADHLTNDFHSSVVADRPAFLLHLGDVIYNFGESQYYYDQFYDPFRNYAAPIFALAGNHDSFVLPGTNSADTPLTVFMRNFCSQVPVVTQEAGSLHRTAMTQPGVYFALDVPPFVRIIALFSNALEDPGLISSQKGQKVEWPGVPDVQLEYLTAQLQNIKTQNYKGVVLIAVHHPPFSYAPQKNSGSAGGIHGKSTAMLKEIDTICKNEGIYPHAFLSGHAHNYQRYTRKVDFAGSNYTVPFVVCGNSGHNVTALTSTRSKVTPPDPAPGADVSYLDANPAVSATGLTLDSFDHTNYGYLRITVDPKELRIEYHPVNRTGALPAVDTVVVDVASHAVVRT